jgi:hypothetical protein
MRTVSGATPLSLSTVKPAAGLLQENVVLMYDELSLLHMVPTLCSIETSPPAYSYFAILLSTHATTRPVPSPKYQ